MKKVKIIKKNNEYSLEYEVGDILEVTGTWYGGVHVAGKTGVPISLDKGEYEEMEEEALKIAVIDKNFSVCKVSDYSQVDLDAEFCFPGKTDQEKSLVCLTENVPANVTDREDGWKAIRIEGILDFSLIGILAKIAGVLADRQISIFAISTFNTDYILIKEGDFNRALNVLARQGYDIVK